MGKVFPAPGAPREPKPLRGPAADAGRQFGQAIAQQLQTAASDAASSSENPPGAGPEASTTSYEETSRSEPPGGPRIQDVTADPAEGFKQRTQEEDLVVVPPPAPYVPIATRSTIEPVRRLTVKLSGTQNRRLKHIKNDYDVAFEIIVSYALDRLLDTFSDKEIADTLRAKGHGLRRARVGT